VNTPAKMTAGQNTDPVDWTLTTWEGARREQLRRWADMPLRDIILALEEMQALADKFAAANVEPNVSRKVEQSGSSSGS
jgi:hypothetical protein